jgi:hypothetical protein
VIDNLQLIKSIGQVVSRAQELGLLCRGLKLMAQALNVPVLLVSAADPLGPSNSGVPQFLSENADLVAMLFT